MKTACQLTEIPVQDFPELSLFYSYFPHKYPFFLTTTSVQQNTCVVDKGHKDFDNTRKPSYDILFIEPGEWLKLDSQLQLSSSCKQLEFKADDLFLDIFDDFFLLEKDREKKSAANAKENSLFQKLPFRGGWFVFLAYELAQQIEPCLNLPLEQQQLPVAFAVRTKTALILDHEEKRLFFLTESDVDHNKAYMNLLSDSQVIRQPENNKPELNELNDLIRSPQEEAEDVFLDSVEIVKNYIREGDVFQVNLSRLWNLTIKHDQHASLAASLYQLLKMANPAPFSGLANFSFPHGNATIISSSPERLLKTRDNQLESRPIAGTRSRSFSKQEDQRLLDELHNHPKEQAEHIMLIDLIRNDLGRVCVPGTVTVDELMSNESYAHVHHIVSNVSGQLQTGKMPSDIIKALFPGGTITGCPKVRCMEIIAELEKKPRGAYTGSMGYINLDGSMDLNILIRTMVLEERLLQQEILEKEDIEQTLTFRAGSGLVFDSIAKNELLETRAKAKGLLRALDRL